MKNQIIYPDFIQIERLIQTEENPEGENVTEKINNTFPDPSLFPPLAKEDFNLYLEMIINPTISRLKNRLSEHEGATGRDAERVRLMHDESMKSFWLALSALHERYLREYLNWYARKLDRDDIKQICSGNDRDLVTRILDTIIGHPTEDSHFKEYVLVANICRHGAGRSLNDLHKGQLNKEYSQWFHHHLNNVKDDLPRLYGLMISSDVLIKFCKEIEATWSRLCQESATRYNPPAPEEIKIMKKQLNSPTKKN